MIIEITMERTQRIAKVIDVKKEQLEELKRGVNPFHEDMEAELEFGNCEYDYAVQDEYGRTIVDWS